MRLWAKNSSSWRRALLVAPVVVANFISATIPVLHSASHHGEHADRTAFPARASLEQQHHEAHPSDLHDQWRVHVRVSIDPDFVAPARLELPEPRVELQLLLPPRVYAAESRAPPAGELARAPPTA